MNWLFGTVLFGFILAQSCSFTLAKETQQEGSDFLTIEHILRSFGKFPREFQRHIVERYAQIRAHKRASAAPEAIVPVRYFINCGRTPCPVTLFSTIEELRLNFPLLIGQRVDDPTAAAVEIYAMTMDIPFEARDRQVDEMLDIDASYTSRRTSCRNYVYVAETRQLVKSLIFVRLISPPEYVSACIALEMGRALGSFGLNDKSLQFMVDRREWMVSKWLTYLQIYLDQDESLDKSSVDEIVSAIRNKYLPDMAP